MQSIKGPNRRKKKKQKKGKYLFKINQRGKKKHKVGETNSKQIIRWLIQVISVIALDINGLNPVAKRQPL